MSRPGSEAIRPLTWLQQVERGTLVCRVTLSKLSLEPDGKALSVEQGGGVYPVLSSGIPVYLRTPRPAGTILRLRKWFQKRTPSINSDKSAIEMASTTYLVVRN